MSDPDARAAVAAAERILAAAQRVGAATGSPGTAPSRRPMVSRGSLSLPAQPPRLVAFGRSRRLVRIAGILAIAAGLLMILFALTQF